MENLKSYLDFNTALPKVSELKNINKMNPHEVKSDDGMEEEADSDTTPDIVLENRRIKSFYQF